MRFLIVLLMVFMTTVANAAVIKSGASSDQLTIGATSKAARVTEYDDRGNSVGQKSTYSAGTTTATATAAGTGPFFSICGSATKTIRVQKFNMNGSVATAATRSNVVLKKTSTATSAGTPTALTQAPHDSTNAAGTSNLVNFYAVLATAGTSVGIVGSLTKNFPITATVAATDYIPEMIFPLTMDKVETEAIVLRGTAQCMEASFGATTTNAPTLSVEVTWTEE